jgi:hypothetical protein
MRTVSVGLSLLLVLVLATPHPARAADPTVKTLVGIIAIALGEPALNDAVDLIDCVRVKGPKSCAAATVKAEGQKAAKQLLPDDPKIAAAVQIIKAAYDQDWIEVLELTGTDALVPIACSAGLAISGPFKGFICGKAAQLAKPVVKTVLVAIKDPSPGNLLAAVTALADPQLACDVVPDFPGKDAICGPLGEVIQFAKDVAEEAAKYGKEAGEFLLDTGEGIVAGGAAALETLCKVATLCDSDGGKQYMSAEAYYKYVLFPRIHDRVRGDLVPFASWGTGWDNVRKVECRVYYDYYTFVNSPNAIAQAVAQKVDARCQGLVGRLAKDADAVTTAMKAAPAPYVESKVKPYIPYAVIESYDYGTGKITEFVDFFSSAKCVGDMQGTFPIPKPTKTKETAWQYLCLQDVSKHTKSAYLQEQGKVGWTLKSLKDAGCVPPTGWDVSKGIKLQCKTEASYQQCLTGLSAGEEQKHCGKAPLSASLKAPVVAQGMQPVPGAGSGASAGARGAQAWKDAPQAKAPEARTPVPALPEGARSSDRSATERKAPPALARAVQPDITSAAQVIIGSTAAQWGTSVGVDAQQAHSAAGGVCQVPIRHTARNIGLAAAGQFSSIWKNSSVPGSWSRAWKPIAAGSADTQTDLVSVKPGANVLSLTLDDTGQLQESNEANNQFRMMVTVSGSCGLAPGIAAPPSRSQPSAPATERTPMGRQPSAESVEPGRANPPAR